jgi:dipeptidyl aminopeptidase/acylaminoacyl peptidase
MIGLLLATIPVVAGDQPADPELAKLPPLIDRDVFFGDPEISGASISPDGAWISFRKPYHDVMNIWVKGVDEPFDAARPLTADTERPVLGYFWSQDSRFILYVQDKGGNENFHVYAVDPKAEAEEGTGVPPARDLTPYEDVRAMIYAVPEATPTKILVGLNDRDPALHDVYRVDIDSGERKLLITNTTNVAAWIADLEGRIRLAYRQTDDGGSEILKVTDGQLGEPVYSCTFEETCVPDRFHKDGAHVYIESNKGPDVDLTRLLLMDAATGETALVESDPEGEVDFGGTIFSDATEELISTYYVGDRVRIYPREETFAHDLEVLRAELPDGELGVQGLTEDMNLMVISVSRDVDPGSVYLYNRKAASVEKLYTSRPDLPTEYLAPMKAVRYPTRDGMQIPAYLTIPKGVEAKGLPTVLYPHGGPWARDTWGYDPVAQFLANRGYAVLQPNFRGSTGYGEAFLNAGNGEWGTGIMQHDLTDAVKYLVSSGVADPERVAIMGGSYGGYATLAGVAFTPDLYAAGVSIVGPSNIITLLDSIPPYWGPIRKIFDKRVGDPENPADRKRLEAQSPLFSATKITAPLLVIQGANDPRVKQAESDQIVVALRDLERPVEYLVAPDEGHGFAGRENRLAMFAVIERFLAHHLGGRYQEGAPPDVAERIAELTVDVGTVKMPVRDEGADAAVTAALPAVDASRLAPVELRYTSAATVMGQDVEIATTTRISPEERDSGRVWKVSTEAESPMGDASDVYVLDAGTLLPAHWSLAQGPVSVELDFTPAKVSGQLTVSGREMPLTTDLDAPLVGDDAALGAFLAATALEPGTTGFLRTFDVQSQKVRLWRLTVEGVETVTVPAGEFEAVKAVVEPVDDAGGGSTWWLATAPARMVVRREAILPAQAGGGTMTTQLTSYEAVE